MFRDLNVLLRTLVLAGAIGLAAWWTLFLKGKIDANQREIEARDAQIVELQGDVAERDERIEELQVALQLLKTDHRIARLQVLDQTEDPDRPGQMRSTLRFTELSHDGVPLGPSQEMTIEGRLAYVDALVIKFEDRLVQEGDYLRGTSVCIFRRIFGENQEPSEGVPLDTVGMRPRGYSAEEAPSEFHEQLWRNFWEYANDPVSAQAFGVRAMQGEAPFIELRPGRSYRIELRASDGLTIRPETPPR
ncbi:MAG TPA: hypothetical protein VGC54_11410 [Planctomycetota bacterium]